MQTVEQASISLNIVKTLVHARYANEFDAHLRDTGFAQYEMLVSRESSRLVLIFPNAEDATVFTLKNVNDAFLDTHAEAEFNYYDSDYDFDTDLAKSLGLYTESENYYYIHR